MREYKTIEEARQRLSLRLEVMVPGAPLRYRPVIIHGPNDGFCVVELGFAEANEFAIAQ